MYHASLHINHDNLQVSIRPITQRHSFVSVLCPLARHLSTTNSLRYLVGIVTILLLQGLNQLDISLLRLLLGDTLIDNLLPRLLLCLAL